MWIGGTDGGDASRARQGRVLRRTSRSSRLAHPRGKSCLRRSTRWHPPVSDAPQARRSTVLIAPFRSSVRTTLSIHVAWPDRSVWRHRPHDRKNCATRLQLLYPIRDFGRAAPRSVAEQCAAASSGSTVAPGGEEAGAPPNSRRTSDTRCVRLLLRGPALPDRARPYCAHALPGFRPSRPGFRP